MSSASAPAGDAGSAPHHRVFGSARGALFAQGMFKDSTYFTMRYDSERERQRYRRQGGCAEIAGHLLDAEGRIVAPQLSERIIAIGFEELRHVPDVILLADGAKRAAATSAALKTGLFNGIVTDASVADHLLA